MKVVVVGVAVAEAEVEAAEVVVAGVAVEEGVVDTEEDVVVADRDAGVARMKASQKRSHMQARCLTKVPQRLRRNTGA